MLALWPFREHDALTKERGLRVTSSKASSDVYSLNDESLAACHLSHNQICGDYESVFFIAMQRIPYDIHEVAPGAQSIPR